MVWCLKITIKASTRKKVKISTFDRFTSNRHGSIPKEVVGKNLEYVEYCSCFRLRLLNQLIKTTSYTLEPPLVPDVPQILVSHIRISQKQINNCPNTSCP